MPTVKLPYTILRSGRTLVWPVFEHVERLSLRTMNIPVRVSDALTKSGVRITVDVNTQIKIRSDMSGLRAAGEQLLGKSEKEIMEIADKAMSAHVRGACSALEMEEINGDRQKFGAQIQTDAVPDLAKLGLEITNFAILDVSDKEGYFDAIGEKRTAEVKRDAAIGRAEAERDAEIKVAQALREKEAARAKAIESELATAKAEADREGSVSVAENAALVAEANKDRDVRIEKARALTEAQRAQADTQYAVNKAKAEQSLANEQKELASRQAAAEYERQKQTVVVPAQAKAEAVAAQAEGVKQEALRAAEASAETIRLAGEAEAAAILAKGEAEAQSLERIAEAYERFGPEALADRALSVTPLVAAEFAKTFQNTEKIVFKETGAGESGMGSMFTDLMGYVPELVKGYSGQDPTELIAKLAGAIRGGGGSDILDA